jgi:peroxiredoxin
MRKSEKTPAAASGKPSKHDAEDAIRSATEFLIATGQAERTLKPGNHAPSFRLRDHCGVEVASETLLRNGPLLLTFYTGLWCPKAHTQLKLGFPILSDRGGRIAELFGVRWRIPEILRESHRKSGIDLLLLNGDKSWTLPIPARFILDKAGLIAYSEINPGQSGSSPPQDVLPVLDHLSRLRAA